MSNIIYEYQEVVNSELKQYITDTPLLHKYFKEDWGVLKARQYCGILNCKGEDFYILPKISSSQQTDLNIFIYMLRFVYDINLENEQTASSKNDAYHDFMEVFIQLFAHQLFQELQLGIYKEYITQQDNLTTLRGKYLINENLKYNFTNSKIYCEYDEFSMDNTLNQFFLFAIKTFLPFVKNKRLLKQCELIFDEVSYRHFDVNNIDVHFHRLNARYKESFEFAIMLLQKFIPLFEKDKKSFAFLFDMNELFEKFIARIYESIDSTTKVQSSSFFGNLLLKPDIITSSMIIDTKYKKVKNKEDLSVADKYQMFVYGTNFGIQNTMLLYPKHMQNVNESLKLGKDDKIINLEMRSIDLNFSGSYREFIEEIKERLESLNGK
jgi:5-methylcytosine-specific restriction enzyme subunit McrC